MSGFGKQVINEARKPKKAPAPRPNIDDIMFGGAAAKAADPSGLAIGKGFNKAMTEDDLPDLYPNSSAPLMQHATGVDVDSDTSSVTSFYPINHKDDLAPTEFSKYNVPKGSEYGFINPHQYIMDTVYKPLGLEDAAKKRLENNPYFRPTGDEFPPTSELMVYNSDDAGDPGRAGFAISPRKPEETSAIGMGGYADNPQRVLRHEARHVITQPEVFSLPNVSGVTDAVNAAAPPALDMQALFGMNDESYFRAMEEWNDKQINADMLQRQQIDSVRELVTHLGDAHDNFARTHGRMVETEADARQAIEEWAARPGHDTRVEPKAKREVLLNAFNGGANDVISRILRNMYLAPLGMAASSQGQDKPRVTEGILQ